MYRAVHPGLTDPHLRADTDTNLKAKHIMQPSHRPSGSQDDYSVPGSWPTYHEVDHRQPGDCVVTDQHQRSPHGYNLAQTFGAQSLPYFNAQLAQHRSSPQQAQTTPFNPYALPQPRFTAAQPPHHAQHQNFGGHGAYFQSGFHASAVPPLDDPSARFYGIYLNSSAAPGPCWQAPGTPVQQLSSKRRSSCSQSCPIGIPRNPAGAVGLRAGGEMGDMGFWAGPAVG